MYQFLKSVPRAMHPCPQEAVFENKSNWSQISSPGHHWVLFPIHFKGKTAGLYAEIHTPTAWFQKTLSLLWFYLSSKMGQFYVLCGLVFCLSLTYFQMEERLIDWLLYCQLENSLFGFVPTPEKPLYWAGSHKNAQFWCATVNTTSQSVLSKCIKYNLITFTN